MIFVCYLATTLHGGSVVDPSLYFPYGCSIQGCREPGAFPRGLVAQGRGDPGWRANPWQCTIAHTLTSIHTLQTV